MLRFMEAFQYCVTNHHNHLPHVLCITLLFDLAAENVKLRLACDQSVSLTPLNSATASHHFARHDRSVKLVSVFNGWTRF